MSDITQTGRWAQECEACHSLDAATVAAAGARFGGRDRFGEHTWTTSSVVDELDPDRRFAFHTVDEAGEPITGWLFMFRPVDDVTIVTEGFERVALPDAAGSSFEDDLFGGRVRHNLTKIATSLEGLAALVERDDGCDESSRAASCQPEIDGSFPTARAYLGCDAISPPFRSNRAGPHSPITSPRFTVVP